MFDRYDPCCSYPPYYPHEHLGPARNPLPSPPPPLPEKIKVGYDDNQQKPVHRPPYLAPLPPLLPPKHTQIQPRCFTCKHFEMCKYKQDYLKTITLMQHDLGSPQKDMELVDKYIVIPGFVGFPIRHEEEFFPKEVTFDNSDDNGKLFMAKFNGINYVNVVYLSHKYYILIKLVYDKETEIYELKSCEEAFYKTEYVLNSKDLETIQLNLVDWREQAINAVAPPPPPSRKPDVINTTHFSASLNCDLYEWNKETFEEAIKRLQKEYPYGIPISEGDRTLYHIATYHIEPDQIPYAPLFTPEKCCKKQPMPYFPPKHDCPKPPKRRDDL